MSDTVVRAVTVPVAFPLTIGRGKAQTELDRQTLRSVLLPLWTEATNLANWGMLELVTMEDHNSLSLGEPGTFADHPLYERFTGFKTQPKKGKRQPRERVGPGYCRLRLWDGATPAAQTILRAVRKKYLACRLGIHWHRNQSVPLYRYPYPYPLVGASFKIYFGSRGESKDRPVLEFVTPKGVVVAVLRSGSEYARQLAQFRDLVSGKAKLLESRVGWDEKNKQFRVALVGKFTPPREQGLVHTMNVRTDPGAFWVADLHDNRAWVLNADQVRGWQDAHRAFLVRTSQDLKFESHTSPERGRILAAREARVLKYRSRLDSFLSESVRRLANFALRNRVAEVIYDDTLRDYLPEFPWFRLKTKLWDVLVNELGIALSADMKEEGPTNGEGED